MQRRPRFSGATYARLAGGADLEGARAEFSVIAAQLAVAFPEANSGYGARVTPLLEAETAHVETQLWFLFAAVACVLLIACANVVNLLLTHAAGRRQELTTRIALGATRAHLVRQAVTEGLVLGVAGGSAGLLLAWLTLPSLVVLAPAAIPRLDEVRIDSGVFLFTAAISVLVGVACGLASSLSVDAASSSGSLRAMGAARSGRTARFRQLLTVAEIALALMLVVAAGLLVRTMRSLGALELGFDPEKVIAVGLSPDLQKYRGPAKALFEAELIARVRGISGVVAAGIGSRPLNAGGFGTAFSHPQAAQEQMRISVDAVGPGYLEALGARLEAGRFVNEADTPVAPAVALVNRTAARRFWPAQDAVGQRIAIERGPVLIVGVVADVRRGLLEEDPEATLYLPSGQTRTFWTNNMLVRTTADPRERTAGNPRRDAPAGSAAGFDADRDPRRAAVRVDRATAIQPSAHRPVFSRGHGPRDARHLWRRRRVRRAAGARDRCAHRTRRARLGCRARLILGQGSLDGGHWHRTGGGRRRCLEPRHVRPGLWRPDDRSRVLHGGRRLSDDCDLGRVRHSSAPGRQNRSRPGAEAGLRSKPRRRNKCQVARGKSQRKEIDASLCSFRCTCPLPRVPGKSPRFSDYNSSLGPGP